LGILSAESSSKGFYNIKVLLPILKIIFIEKIITKKIKNNKIKQKAHK